MSPSKVIIESILSGCEGNHAWYRDYMVYNWPRVYNDFCFLRRRLPKQSAILDIGAIPPLLVALLRVDGFQDVSVADPCAATFSTFFNNVGIKSYSANLLDLPSVELNERFDLVCLNEVVEHLSGNLLTALGNSVACVKSGGQVLVTTPNLRSVSGIVALLWYSSGLASKPKDTVRAQYERASAKYGYYGHLREFTPKEVIDLMESFGLEQIESAFMPNYINQTRLMRLCAVLERCIPTYRLFGKYLFRRVRVADKK